MIEYSNLKGGLVTDNIAVYNCDNKELLKQTPNKHYDIAIIDPPYGIGESGKAMLTRHHSQKKYAVKVWDKESPDAEFFKEIVRVSKHQIIWGANHFIEKIPNANSSCWLYWDKDRYGDFADGELAWTSFKSALRMYKFTWDGFRKQMPCNRIHPTEKPVNLYKWILQNYGSLDNVGGGVLDTHLGSGSIAIACHDLGFKLTACELDPEYYEMAVKRIKQHKAQTTLF